MHLELVGPQTANTVLNAAQMNGAVGRGHQAMDKSVKRLLANDGFDLKGGSRLQKFTNTIKAFAKGGASTGAMLGTGIMFVPDALTGRGRVRAEFDRDHFMDKGILGNMGWGLTVASSVAVEGIGAATGATLGAINPGALMSNKPYTQWIKKHAKGGQQAGGGMTATIVGGTIGTVLTITRIPSLFVKYTLAGALAIPSTIIGFIGGSIRAIIDK